MANISESLVKELAMVLKEYDMTLPAGPEAAAKAVVEATAEWLYGRDPFSEEPAEQHGFGSAIGMLENEIERKND